MAVVRKVPPQTAAYLQKKKKDVEIPAKELLKATDYKVEKYVKLNDYMNMTVELSKDYTVSDADIQSYIEYLMSMYPSYEVSDKKTVEMR